MLFIYLFDFFHVICWVCVNLCISVYHFDFLLKNDQYFQNYCQVIISEQRRLSKLQSEFRHLNLHGYHLIIDLLPARNMQASTRLPLWHISCAVVTHLWGWHESHTSLWFEKEVSNASEATLLYKSIRCCRESLLTCHATDASVLHILWWHLSQINIQKCQSIVVL